MNRYLAYLTFVCLAPIAAGLFGIAHNQISYAVAPEYFTHFKFEQFGLQGAELPERIRASLVGWRASWWMGIPLGLLGGLGLLFGKPPTVRVAGVWRALAAMAGTTLAVALSGLIYGYLTTRTIDVAAYSGWYVPPGVDLRRFLCAGYMHNSAYVGGLIALPAAWITQIREGRHWPSAER